MKMKRSSLFLGLMMLWAITAIYAKPAGSKKELREISELVLKSSRVVERIESKLVELCDLSEQAARGSYSQIQRDELDSEFQELLTRINPAVERASLDGQNMLNSDEKISVNAGKEVLEFYCIDVTLKGLGLDGGLKINEFPDASTAYDHLKAAVRKIKAVDLQFADYINALSEYLRNVKPVLDKEIKMTLEMMEASSDAAEMIKANLQRAKDLIDASTGGLYSDTQRIILDAEFQELLSECDRAANEAYFGMGMINSTDSVFIEAGGQTLEFACFDLTRDGLGLTSDLSIVTSQDAQAAYPYIENALESIDGATTTLNDDIDTLSKYLSKKKK